MEDRAGFFHSLDQHSQFAALAKRAEVARVAGRWETSRKIVEEASRMAPRALRSGTSVALAEEDRIFFEELNGYILTMVGGNKRLLREGGRERQSAGWSSYVDAIDDFDYSSLDTQGLDSRRIRRAIRVAQPYMACGPQECVGFARR